MNAINKKRQRHLSLGFSLPEVMIAMLVLGIVAFGFTGSLILSQKLATENLIRTSAYTIAQSYLDQIRLMPAGTLNQSINNSKKYPLPTRGISEDAKENIVKEDPLYLKQRNQKTIIIESETKDGKTKNRTMNLYLTPRITDLKPAMNAYEIVLDFEYEARHLRGTSTRKGSLRFYKINLAE
tara:strand:+ start:521 stop:1066 length:546 start_codon:yes stop_codon:yes gene_type:complete